MFRIVQRRRVYFLLSLILLVPGIIGLSLWGLKLGIDFTGGSIITYQNATDQRVESLRQVFAEAELSSTIQPTGDGGVTVRLPHITPEQRQSLEAQILQAAPELQEQSFETIGPSIGRELRTRAIIGTLLVLAGILAYVSWAFRRVSIGPVRPWVYGAATVVALFHDVFIVIGVFAILGHFANIEIDSLFVTALLTVLGFSVHDTIVVFDRVRERLLTQGSTDFEETVNASVNQTIVRSLNTSLTTLFVLVALFLFGGESLRSFTLALIIGIAAGAYSSIFMAAPLLVVWQRWQSRR